MKSCRVWIYTQDRPFTGKRIYNPVRNPDQVVIFLAEGSVQSVSEK